MHRSTAVVRDENRNFFLITTVTARNEFSFHKSGYSVPNNLKFHIDYCFTTILRTNLPYKHCISLLYSVDRVLAVQTLSISSTDHLVTSRSLFEMLT